jgi:hypothetical protein
MTDFYLANHVYAGADKGGLVFLDIKADRYVCLPLCAAGAEEDRLSIAGVSLLLSRRQCKGLEKRGLISIAPPLSRDAALRAEGSINAQEAQPKLRDMRGVLRACAKARVQLQKPFANLLDLNLTRYEREPDAKEIQALVAAFEAWRPYYPRARICLFDCIAMRSWLAQYGIASRIVFGVKTRPFEAHCWLQSGVCVINERLERARSFQPILAV